jgi:filamentous hemagglutinin family protein
MSQRPAFRLSRSRLLTGVSAVALVAGGSAARAQAVSPFARVANPAAQVAQAAASQAAVGAAASASSQQALAAFAQASAIRSQMDAAQAAARSAAAAAQASVANGLAAGGLQPVSGAAPGSSLWLGAAAPTQATAANGRTEVSVQQTQAQAILNWQTFNVGQQTDLSFNQQSSSWVVLNRVNDPNANPTQILGSISAPGTVLIINRNGVIFGGGSQINVGNLVAAAANMTDNQFLTDGIYSSTSGSSYAPSFTDALGKVDVQAGAQITTNTPPSVLQGGGYVMLLGGQVQNEGSITTPMGQTLLAAGDAFLLRPGVSTTGNQWSTTRGSEVAPVIASDSVNGQVANTGVIYSQQGDITLAGHTILQGGVLLSTTSVNQRGTIHLLNSASDATGSVTLTDNSYTAILPELDSTATAVDSQRSALIADSVSENGVRGLEANAQFDDLSLLADREDQSRVEIVTGGNVEFQGGSLTQAQGGQVAVSAANRIQIDTGATIDVSGVQNVALDVSTNSIMVNIQGNELRDSPINRDAGTLFNSNVWVNINDLTLLPAGTGGDASARDYTAGGLIEASGYLSNVGHTIGEWDAVGGTITLSAKEVVAQPGSLFNVSGGSLAYQGGDILETLLQGADGNIYTADNAPADIQMVSVGQSFTVTHDRWGDQYTQTWQSPFTQTTVSVYEPGYVVGKDGGQLILSTPTALFEGVIDAEVIDGVTQTASRPAGVTDSYSLPQGVAPLPGGLSLGQFNAGGLFAGYKTDIQFDDDVPSAAANLGVSDPISTARVGTAWFDASALSGANLGAINVSTSGDIAVNAPLSVANGGVLSLVGANVSVNANLTARSGSITISNVFTANPATGGGTIAYTNLDGSSLMQVAAGVVLDARGLWVNAMVDPDTAPGLAFVNGGNVAIDGSGDVTLNPGSVIDVSSGGGVLANGKVAGGQGGNVTLVAGDPVGNAGPASTLTLDATIRAEGVTGGGTLTISAPGTIVIGDDASLSGGVLTLAAGTPAHANLTLAAPLTIPTGGVLPLALSQVLNDTPVDTPTTTVLTALDPRNPTGTSQLVTQADWVVPAGMQVNTDAVLFAGAGTVIPKGTTINFFWITAIPVGTVIPSAVFPQGIPVTPYQVVLPAGSVAQAPVTYVAGTVIPAGTVFQQPVSILPVMTLPTSLFQSGFANYNVNAGAGLLVAGGTTLAPTMPVYQFTAASMTTPTGADPASALSSWLPPLFTQNPVTATLTQRGGASLTLSSVSDVVGVVSGGAVTIAPDASIAVDPGQNIKLDAFGQITVDGDLTAHGGAVSVISEASGATDASRNFSTSGTPRGNSIWIGGDAAIDVSGEAFTALDQYGRAYGVATNGGSIHLGGSQISSNNDPQPASTTAFVIIRPGADLDADGVQVTVDPAAGSISKASGGQLNVASSGGSIELDSFSGIYNDGDLHAHAGGPGAAGGSLSIILDTPYFANTGGTVQAVDLVPSVLTLVQSQPTSLLPADIAPGTDASSLVFGQTTVSANAIQAGGFDTVSLFSRDLMEFPGNVSLKVGQSLTLTADAFISGPGTTVRPDPTAAPTTGSVTLSAPYVLMSSAPIINGDGTQSAALGDSSSTIATATTGTFEIDADQIDIQGSIIFSSAFFGLSPALYAPGFENVNLVSQGAIRFLAPTSVLSSFDSLDVPFNLNLTASQIYPATGAQAYIVAGSANGGVLGTGTITINPAANVNLTPPESVFGQLIFNAAVINQGGVLIAPLGQITLGTNNGGFHGYAGQFTQSLTLLPGSFTSVSGAGLTMPYGGTSDGVNYDYNGAAISPVGIGGVGASILTLDSASIDVQKGAVVDLAGGGTLAGSAFISGRGGSVNVLDTPLVNANPTVPFSSASDQVYAIVPGYASAYAPSNAENGAGNPKIGQQITIPAGVPGLPAGTYTLLPSNYALLPGAFRVELGKPTSPLATGVGSIGFGAYVTAGYTGVANTGVKSALPSLLLITPGSGVRDDSQFDEETYSAFVTAQVTQFGGAVPVLPADAGTLVISLQAPNPPATGSAPAAPTAPGSALTFQGAAMLQGGVDPGTGATGYGGTVSVTAAGSLEIYNGAPTPGFAGISVDAASLDAIAAPRLIVGGNITQGFGAQGDILTVSGSGQDIFVRPGVTLQGGEIFLTGGNIDIGADATLTTIGQSAAPYDSTNGYVYEAGGTVLALSNGVLDFVGSNAGTGAITIGAGAGLYAGGTLAFATNGASSIDNTAHFGAKDISLAVSTINIGSSADIAAAGAPAGLQFDQSLFNFLVAGDPTHGAPALQMLTLAASGSINVFGDASLDASGAGVDLVLNTPAIYGYGAAGSQATIAASKITWNGASSPTLPAIVAGGPGTGQGALTLQAAEIDLGGFVDLDSTVTSRVAYGFSNLSLVANSQIVSGGDSALAVYQAPSTAPGATLGQSGTGGSLTLSTPLLTGLQKSIIGYSAGGAIQVTTPAGVAPSTASTTVAGAEIDLTAGDSVGIDTTILLPSGKLQVNAVNAINLGASSRIDLSGQPSTIQGTTVYGFGGDVILNSVSGGVVQAPGGVIDVSATQANAGSITIGAGAGAVALQGALRGAATAGYTSGDFALTAGSLADFAGLNAILTAGGVFDSRSFDIKTGDLTIGDGVQAHSVNVSVDGGSLTVNGTIDASGPAPGTITLAAIDGLTLAPSAVLDAHGTVLQVDSYNQPIDAENEGVVALTATHGMLTLSPGATIDVSAPDGVARGEINLNASRTGETSGDINIDASGPLTIKGAMSIAVNGFWNYAPTDPYGTIVQDNGDPSGDPVAAATGFVGLNQIDARSQAFINAALTNQGLLGRLAGLTSYTDAFHLRPGVEIDSSTPNGALTVAGDIDLSNFRYASLNPNFQQTAGVYGSGEPGVLVIRAGGDLDIVGSISDGFLPAPSTASDNGWLLQAGAQTANIETLAPIVLDAGTTFPNTAGLSLRYDIQIGPSRLNANVVIPIEVTLSAAYTVPAGTKLAAPVYDAGGHLLYPAGMVMTAATTLPAGAQLAAGSVMPGVVAINATTWPAGDPLGDFNGSITLSQNATVPFEGVIPQGANVLLDTASAPTRPTNANGMQGSLDAVAAMLPAGDLSWSITLVAGADLGAADVRVVKPASLLRSLGVSGNLTLLDTHLDITGASTVEVKKYFYYYDGIKYYTSGPNGFGCTHYGNTSCGSAYVAQTTPASINGPDPSVVRTGTGDLSLLAGGSFSEQSLFGVYTAGTQSPPILTNGQNPYNAPQGALQTGEVVPDPDKNAVDQATYQAWYPEHGGNLLLSAQGDIVGNIAIANNNVRFVDSDLTSNWLLRQGGGGVATAPTAWWINFGTFGETSEFNNDSSFLGFSGIGTLGGGNLTVIAGGNAGAGLGAIVNGTSTGLDLAVGSTGRVLADGTLVQTGGGVLTLKIGGVLNPLDTTTARGDGGDYFGSITDLRGDINIEAGAIGVVGQEIFSSSFTSLDPRVLPYGVFKIAAETPGPTITPGDGVVTIDTRGDLVIGGASDAGTQSPLTIGGDSYTLINPDGTTTAFAGGAGTAFTLWTPSTAISLYSAGGDVTPLSGAGSGNQTENGDLGFYPGTLIVAAANGDIRMGGATSMELLPSPTGQLELLANGSIYGSDQTVAMSGAAMSTLATPFQPVFTASFVDGGLTNASKASPNFGGGYKVGFENPIAFGEDTPTTDLHAGDNQPALVLAGVDIDDLTIGDVVVLGASFGDFAPVHSTWYIGAKPFDVIAGRDIVGTGVTPDLFVNNTTSDISLIQAGRDIIYESATIAGPGLLDVQAGRNLYQGYYGQLVSVGPLYGVDPTNPSTGAGITVMAGVGPNGPDYADFAKLYFNAANQLPTTGEPLAGSGDVVHAYDQELLTWLQQRFGYTGTSAGALAYFLALPNDQQGVFVRQVYYEELTAGGREYNDPTSPRFKSYLRGRNAIAALFPTTDANGNPISYTGDITMFSGLAKTALGSTITDDSGIRTEFGGDIQILNPGGQAIIGVEGVAPGSNAGLLTEGAGNIDIYSEGSILLGESRILTTFGGDILAWSATGDINAGRGSKTTVVFTPPRRVYDNYGNVTLSPSIPSTGAGIGTLNPIPQVPPGDVDLIAPLGTVDAGEAGIRVSGNINIAALHVINAANIQVQGTSTGLPQAVAVNTGALTAASHAATAVDVIINQLAAQPPAPPPEPPSIIFGRFLGFGDQ